VSKKDEFILDMLRIGYSQREIAVYFDVSESRISQVVSEIKKNLSVLEDINNVIEIDWITL
jgi:DNA-binding NarL/FixJ family response regulator